MADCRRIAYVNTDIREGAVEPAEEETGNHQSTRLQQDALEPWGSPRKPSDRVTAA